MAAIWLFRGCAETTSARMIRCWHPRKICFQLSRVRAAAITVRREGNCHEVAYGILFVAIDEASFNTGGKFSVDGGWTCQ